MRAIWVVLCGVGCVQGTTALPTMKDREEETAPPSLGQAPAEPPVMNDPPMDPPHDPPMDPPHDPPQDPALTPEQQIVFDAVKKEQLTRLDEAVGQFTSGRSPAYRGTFSASDNKGVLQGQANGVMTSGPVVAALEARSDLWTSAGQTPGVRLYLVNEAEAKQFVFTQHPTLPGTTYFSFVQEVNTSGGVTATCSGCIAAFDSTKTTLTVTGSATGKWGTGTTMTVSTSGSLTKLAPETLTFEELVSINRSQSSRWYFIKDLLPVAGTAERARPFSGRHKAPSQVPAGMTYDHCERVTPYTIEVYVDTADLTQYGVRNFSTETAQTCCYKTPAGMAGCEFPTCF